jgi:hypothetical protein
MNLRSHVALKRIRQRLTMNMSSYTAKDGTKRLGMHDTLISLSESVQLVMDYISGNKDLKFHGRIRAVDMRNVLLLMPFVMQDVLLPEVTEWNRKHPESQRVDDPSNQLVDILCDLLEWYQRFRANEHTMESIVDIDERGRVLIQKCMDVFPEVKTIKVDGEGTFL